MPQLLGLLKLIGPPGSIGFLALCSAVGLVLRSAGKAGLGRRWLLFVYVVYVIAGLPWVARTCADGLSRYRPIEDLSAIDAADALVVLHGDNVNGRVLEAKRIFDAAGRPPVLVLGDGKFVDQLVGGGLVRERMITGASPVNTYEQIAAMAVFIRERNLRKPVLVASRLHMPRIAALLRAAKLDVALAPSPLDNERAVSGFIPSYGALRVTSDVLYEHMALRYYKRQRWIE